jgi:prevent-host-death family protein
MDTNIRELKAHLSQYVRRAEQGETVKIKAHSREVARLMPPQPRPDISDLQNLIGLRWAGGKPLGLSGERLPAGKTLSEAIIEDRR